MTASTRQEQVREQISALADEGLDSVDIAARLGVTVSRVDQVLDQLEGTRVAALPRPTLPMRHPAGPPAPKKVASVPVPKQEVASPAPPAPPAPRRRIAECGTRSGYQRHYSHGEKPCQACKDAWNASERAKKAAKRPTEQRFAIKCGTINGYRKHTRDDTPICDPCRAARNEYQRARHAARRDAVVTAAKPKVQVHWLIPRGATMDSAHLEYAVEVAGRTVPCSFGTAELAAAHSEKVLSRWATDWVDAR